MGSGQVKRDKDGTADLKDRWQCHLFLLCHLDYFRKKKADADWFGTLHEINRWDTDACVGQEKRPDGTECKHPGGIVIDKTTRLTS